MKEIPQHWKELRLKNVSERNVVGIAEAATHAYSDDGIPILRATNIREGKIIGKILKIDPKFAFAKERESKIIREGDLVSVRTGNAGKTVLIGNEIGRCHCFTMLITTPSQLASGKFLEYVINSKASQEYFSVEGWGTAQLNISVPIIQNLPIAIPSLDEQTDIANFLNHETTKIDALIAEQERLIELLQEKRQAVISHAVTKGLNPDAPMKDSGVEWLGEVPEHWGVMGLTKTIGPIVDYRGRTPTKCDSGTLLVTAKNIRNGEIDYGLSEEYVDPVEAEQLLQRGRPSLGDVLFTMEAPLGQVALIDREDIALAQRVVKFRGTVGRMTNSFLMWWLISSGCQQQLNSLSTGSTALGIKASKLSAVVCAVPPVEEQQAIDDHIRASNSQLKSVQAAAETQIALLQERRSALISAAVTGQIDVRGLFPGEASA
ncbi:restriction endonuclease subunit S [Synechococcus sp. A10-1-5-9]|uniref:restriction endonuclease subunit S n=1 Tax=Synechococcus sp. A10-1-5-9 TaxID=3392295 RepID=UPI0039EA370E